MGDFQYFDIILFAMIAGFLVLRLRSVLGRRTGNERRRDGFLGRFGQGADKNESHGEPNQNAVAAVASRGAQPADAVAQGLEKIRRVDPSFDPGHFIEGARAAFEMIVSGFAGGDKSALRPLLSDEVYERFAGAIDERSAARETLETKIVRPASADVVSAGLLGQTAQVAVKIISQQINLTRGADGSIVDGDPDQPIDKTDYWTFARDIRSTDPNWVLAATGGG